MTSRLRILDLLRAHPGATAAEIARGLRQTPANVRHHLAGLERDRLVSSARLVSHGRGRPAKAYRLSAQSSVNPMAALAAALLRVVIRRPEAPERELVLARTADELMGLPLPPEGSSLPRRLAALMESLGDMNYQPRWEAHAAGPRVIFANCPFSAIIQRHPELCQLDAHIVERSLGLAVEQISKLEPNERGLPTCVFALHPAAWSRDGIRGRQGSP